MDIQKTITEAMANEDRAVRFIRKLIYDEVRIQLKLSSCAELQKPKYTHTEDFAEKYRTAAQTLSIVYDVLVPRMRPEGWVDDYDALKGIIYEALNVINRWREEEGKK